MKFLNILLFSSESIRIRAETRVELVDRDFTVDIRFRVFMSKEATSVAITSYFHNGWIAGVLI